MGSAGNGRGTGQRDQLTIKQKSKPLTEPCTSTNMMMILTTDGQLNMRLHCLAETNNRQVLHGL
jgi:hypothetical protein